MNKASEQCLNTQRSAYLKAEMDLEEALGHAEAIAALACGEGGSVLRRMSDEIQDNYMGALWSFVRQAKAASEAMNERSSTRNGTQGAAR